MRESHAPWIVWALLTVLAWAVLGLIVGAPVARAHGQLAFAGTVYEVLSPFCHQISERSFHVGGEPFAVCARCTGIFAGFALAALAYPLARPVKHADLPALFWLAAAAVPLAIDFLLGHFGIWENTHASRFSTGALLGAVAVLFVVPALVALGTFDWREAS